MNKYILTYSLFESDEFRQQEYSNFRENPTLIHQLLEMDEKKFNELYPKYEWHLVNNTKSLIKNNLFVLVNMAFDKLGGHVRINSPEKIVQDTDINFWIAADDNNDPYADIVIFGRKTSYGIKISGFGHNCTSNAKKELVDYLVKLLNIEGYFIEASGKTAKKLIEKNAPYVKDIEVIRKIFKDPNAHYINNQWYIRSGNIMGNKYEEILFGKPII
jgi:hypothetical protein